MRRQPWRGIIDRRCLSPPKPQLWHDLQRHVAHSSYPNRRGLCQFRRCLARSRRLPGEDMWATELVLQSPLFDPGAECDRACLSHVVDTRNAIVLTGEDLPGSIRKDAPQAAAGESLESGPACSGHVIEAHDAPVEVRDVDLPGGAHEHVCDLTKLIDPCTDGADGGPSRPLEVVDANDSVVERVRDVDLPGGGHGDTSRNLELINSRPIGTEGGPPCPGHVVDSHDAMVP